MRGTLRAFVDPTQRVPIAIHDEIVETVLERALLIDAEQPSYVGFVVAEQQFGAALDVQRSGCEFRMKRLDSSAVRHLQERTPADRRPSPRVPCPTPRENMRWRRTA